LQFAATTLESDQTAKAKIFLNKAFIFLIIASLIIQEKDQEKAPAKAGARLRGGGVQQLASQAGNTAERSTAIFISGYPAMWRYQ
jgi:hypothetical protein